METIDYFKKDCPEIQKRLPKDNYPEIVNKVLQYINYIKTEEKAKSQKKTLVDIIYDFCLNNDYDPELVGDAIRSDEYFSRAILNECIANGTVKDPNQNNNSCKLKEW